MMTVSYTGSFLDRFLPILFKEIIELVLFPSMGEFIMENRFINVSDSPFAQV